ncbi:hypothetical protein GCM10010302_58040 [Streptomyces polychromogenes]|uniref:Histidine kinase/HSP90-like ATPase domain-containing protein n=1 Tax=Streptomyces polychromogenes TaxID=67342 RepID=A0ABN0VMU4_9ACTN
MGERLHAWGFPYGTEAHDTLTVLVAELATNAVRHGRVPSRDFRVRLTAMHPATVPIEATDTRGERLPEPATCPPGLDRTDGGGGETSTPWTLLGHSRRTRPTSLDGRSPHAADWFRHVGPADTTCVRTPARGRDGGGARCRSR